MLLSGAWKQVVASTEKSIHDNLSIEKSTGFEYICPKMFQAGMSALQVQIGELLGEELQKSGHLLSLSSRPACI